LLPAGNQCALFAVLQNELAGFVLKKQSFLRAQIRTILAMDWKGLMPMKVTASTAAKIASILLLLLFSTALRATETILVGADAEWRYYNLQDPPTNDWNTATFNADSWKVGHAQLGYGDDDETTVIDGGALNPHPVSAYFRKSFVTDTPAVFSKLVFRLLRDDGAVVYLNGVEVIRSNMPEGPISPGTLAPITVDPDAENTLYTYEIPASGLITGENLVAVEVHQANVASSDVSFALQVIGVSGETNARPTVSIVAAQNVTREPDAITKTAPGRFVISRTGSLDAVLPVYIRYDGTATPDADYPALPIEVDLQPGEASHELLVIANDDHIKETVEFVVAKISEPPTNPTSVPYNIAPDQGSARVDIFDSQTGIQITSPTNTASFNLGTTITIRATAVAAGGTIQRVQFYDGETLIGTSAPIFIEPPQPGAPIFHKIEWTPANIGEHVLTGRGVVSDELGSPTTGGTPYISQKVVVRVLPSSEIPTISIEATRPVTSEPLPDALVASGLFTIHRSEPTNTSFNAFVLFSGTATSGEDYKPLTNWVHFEAGQVQARLEVVPLSDDLVEGDESVVAQLSEPPTGSAVAFYKIDPDHNRAEVVIRDEDTAPAHIEITSPEDGVSLDYGSTVAVKATAVDPNGYIPRVEFFSDDVSIGVSEINFLVAPTNGTPIYHEIEWKNVPAGVHKLTAHGVTSGGVAVASPPVTVYVIAVDPPPPSIVSIRKVEDPTLRPIPNADYASDFFEIRRTWPTNQDLQVFFRVPQDGEHIATPDVDYHALKSPVTIPAGQFSAYMRVEAIDDTLVEGPEIVRVTLVLPIKSADGTVPRNYTIDPEHSSADVTILDNDQSTDQVVVSVEVPDGVASEVTTTDAFDTARFLIRRVSGPKDVAVTVYYEMSGTAQNGIDYRKVTGTAELQAGLDTVGVEIVAIPDDIAEGEETVILTLTPPVCSAIFPPAPDCYLIGEHGSGRAVILDHRDDLPGVKILQPLNGAVFNLGNVIQIEAQAWDREGIISKLEILADGQLLGDTNSDHIFVIWSKATVGEHSIVARATDGSGQIARTEIHILVRGENDGAFVFRKLPPAYTPGTAVTVELRAEPPAGSRAYAVEDHPPTNWVVSEISNDGVFDPATGKVKYGPFTDTTARTLTYRVTPPDTATGRKEFFGVGSIDGASYRIGGDRIIDQSPTEHPADTDKNFAIVVGEVTAYAAAWKNGDDIPLSYVTRAGYIWKHGEGYRFDGSLEPPFCWVPLQQTAATFAAATVEENDRVCDGQTQPGVSGNIEIHIAPPAGTSSYAVEENVPLGWTVSNINNAGSFDPATGTIRWGVFFDATARSFSYTLTPPPAVTAVARIEGWVSYDGVLHEITGTEKMISTDDTTRPVLGKCESDGSGVVHLELKGGAGQVGVLQSSSDLIHWQDVTTLYLPDGTVQFDDDSRASVVRYYRLQVR
jgi:hypothetical protein